MRTASDAAFSIRPAPPYSFERTAEYATHYRRREGVEAFIEGEYMRLLDLGGRLAFARVRSAGTCESPLLNVRLEPVGGALGPADVDAARALISRVLGVAGDPSSFYEAAASDDALRPVVERFHGLHIPLAASLFESMAWAILGQQISAQVARVLRDRIITTYGASACVDGADWHVFPRPDALAAASVDDLRAMGLSLRKAEYLRDVAGLFASGDLDEYRLAAAADEEVARTLLAVRGIGPWTVEWLMIRGLGRPDGLPAGDVALQRVLGELVHGVPMTPAEVTGYAERYRPHRSYLTLHIFALIRSRRAATAPVTLVEPKSA